MNSAWFFALRPRLLTNARGEEIEVLQTIRVPLCEIQFEDLKIMSIEERVRCLFELAAIGHGVEGGEIVDLHPEREPSRVVAIDLVRRIERIVMGFRVRQLGRWASSVEAAQAAEEAA